VGIERNIKNIDLRKLENDTSVSYDVKLDDFLYARYNSSLADDVIPSCVSHNQNDLIDRLSFDNKNPIWCIFLHINWDAVASHDAMLFSSFDEWTIKTIEKICNISGVNWLLKIHPHETTYYGFGETVQLINNEFPLLPDNVKIIPPDTNLSTQNIFSLINGGVTVYGTSGLELAALGKPVILAGNPYYANDSYTLNPKTRDEYFMLLESAGNIKPLSDNAKKTARQFAYLHFLGSQIKHPLIHAYRRSDGELTWDLMLDKLSLLKPGADSDIELVVDGIVNGSPYFYQYLLNGDKSW